MAKHDKESFSLKYRHVFGGMIMDALINRNCGATASQFAAASMDKITRLLDAMYEDLVGPAATLEEEISLAIHPGGKREARPANGTHKPKAV